LKKNLSFLLFIVLLSLGGCSVNGEVMGKAHLFIKKTDYPLLLWKSDGSYIETATGSLLLGDKPIEKAMIKIGDKFVKTDKKGSFEYNVDQSKLSKKEIKVSNLDKALVNGKKLTKEEKQTLGQVNGKINVYYPINIISKKEENKKTIIDAQVLTKSKSPYPTVQTGKYAVLGTVKDADGNPIKGAIVSITREKGEGWAHSNPSDNKGHYLLAYLPEADEECTFRVSVGDVQYTLPNGKVYQFPDNTSVKVDIILPKSGTIIDDKPPTLISKVIPGSMKLGTIIGIDGVSPNDYSITVPEDDGHFRLIVSNELWKKKPTFFEKKVEGYYQEELTKEDFIPKEWLKEKNPKEPDSIKTIP
jgi:hypothetical protein